MSSPIGHQSTAGGGRAERRWLGSAMIARKVTDECFSVRNHENKELKRLKYKIKLTKPIKQFARLYFIMYLTVTVGQGGTSFNYLTHNSVCFMILS